MEYLVDETLIPPDEEGAELRFPTPVPEMARPARRKTFAWPVIVILMTVVLFRFVVPWL